MSRKAILIEASKIPGCTDLAGARADVHSFSGWLASSPGGAWEGSEITVLSHPSKARLEACLADAARADYAFIAFSGHGEHVVGKLRNDTMIQINPNEDFSARKLATACRRATVVVDSCRNVTVEFSLNESVKYAKAKRYAEDFMSRRRHRALFDSAVAAAEEGTVFMFGCSHNQSANDFPNGGAFSFGLVDGATTWVERAGSGSILTIYEAFQKAMVFVQSEVSNQVPEMDGAIRRKRHFPFAVVA